VAYGKGLFVGLGFGSNGTGTIITSPDGSAWTIQRTNIVHSFWAVSFGNEKFVAAGACGQILTSTNGVDWRFSRPVTVESFLGITFAKGHFMAVGSNLRLPQRVFQLEVCPGEILSYRIEASSDLLNW